MSDRNQHVSEVVLGGRAATLASDGHEVERPIELAIAASVEAVPVLALTGSDVDGCGPAEASEGGFAVAAAGV